MSQKPSESRRQNPGHEKSDILSVLAKRLAAILAQKWLNAQEKSQENAPRNLPLKGAQG